MYSSSELGVLMSKMKEAGPPVVPRKDLAPRSWHFLSSKFLMWVAGFTWAKVWTVVTFPEEGQLMSEASSSVKWGLLHFSVKTSILPVHTCTFSSSGSPVLSPAFVERLFGLPDVEVFALFTALDNIKNTAQTTWLSLCLRVLSLGRSSFCLRVLQGLKWKC